MTVYLIGGRGYEDACQILGADYAGVLERDGWAPYRSFIKARHQTCYAHLLKRTGELIEDSIAGQARVPHAAREHMFTFLSEPGVQATSWRAEQPLRPAIVNRKNWRGNRTDAGARTQVIAISVIRTARQQNIDPIEPMTAAQHDRVPGVSDQLTIPTARAGPALAA